MYRVIVADPPWSLGPLPGGRASADHYTVMPTADIYRLQLPPVQDHAVLFLWRLASMPQEALDVARAWGFEPKTEIVWIKQTPTGKSHFGMGAYVRGAHETCLIAVRGKKMRPKNFSTRSVFAAPVMRHSEKPEEFYRIVESLYDGPYVELFARRPRPGWRTIGTDLGERLEVA